MMPLRDLKIALSYEIYRPYTYYLPKECKFDTFYISDSVLFSFNIYLIARIFQILYIVLIS